MSSFKMSSNASATAFPPAMGRLIVLSGPSGSGKTSLIREALASGDLPLRLAISATTRQPRPGEIDGQHYHFWTSERFLDAIHADKFLEHAKVYGHHYGTLREEVEPYLQRGINVLLEIDVQGGLQVQQQMPECITVFLRASTPQEYERRLRLRNTDSPASLEKRLQSALEEIDIGSRSYQFQIINDDLKQAVQDFRRLVTNLPVST
ncbi:MAG TPA: guanylate kinase [Gemmatales bacterium]|nr:guanylate kinase [Gemmatales bacterium]